MRAFALAFPSLHTLPWKDVLSLFNVVPPKVQDFLVSIQKGLDLSGLFYDPEDGSETDWRGWYEYHQEDPSIGIYPYIGDRSISITVNVEGKYCILVNCSARTSRRAMSHLISLIEKGIITPNSTEWE
ncbi:MAG: hypothetical protein A3H01_00910 [Candidatus Wildermuthbacteria bacterium RIFCSPLOWO2_12_FULL_40_9]|nr:MAG: hypothetical protein A3H01_00910 [Candidatus Wildermuthbacteria bacterium RIFCSPLOWO2_12_FULL_40_9]